ncbi:MAG: hypothetical protein RMM53_04940 [Bacteroidia bacterium]|nr:hypothetical protein [Bacteroidia bacterium]MDW8333544.1 hypothetical protein [Bacteroidia bacterium]
MKKLAAMLCAVMLCAAPISLPAQCPMCKQNVLTARKAGNNSVGNGLNDGILYLLAAPYILSALVALGWYRAYRKSRTSSSAD